jgi:plasmid stabilization system protein ParE
MKSAVIPQIRVEPELRAELESVLRPGETLTDFVRAQAAIDAIRATVQHLLASTPFSFRKAAQNPAQRELVIPFGGTGYVAMHEIVSPSKVVVLALRHQREEDCH